MASVTQYSADTANALLDLIDVAGGDLNNVRLPNTPPTKLNAVTTFENSAISSGGGRGVLVAGTLAGGDGNVAVLALAADWSLFDAYFRQSYLTGVQSPPPSLGLDLQIDKSEPTAQIASGYQFMFGKIRNQVWTALEALANVPGFGTSYPLIVVGMGPAAPLAQMVAAEVRPGQSDPVGGSGAKSKVSAVASYVFSCAGYGNDNFGNGLLKAVPASFVVNLDTVDHYPSDTGSPADWTVSGARQSASAKVPVTDVPWLERTPVFYQTAFGGGQPALPGNGTTDQPKGFSADLAYTLSTLGMIVYGLEQHPELGASPAIPSGYTLEADIKVNGVLWGLVFTTLGKVIVALRGPCSWVEILAFYDDGTTRPFPGSGAGGVLTGLSDFFPDLLTATTAALKDISGIATSDLYFTGHDFGGSLATMVGYNQKVSPAAGIAATTGIYGIGTNRFCDYVFVSTLTAALPDMCFQVTRPNDKIAASAGLSLLAPPPVQVSLIGGTTSRANSTTGHTLAIYNSLMNPRASATAAAGKGAPNALELGILAAPAQAGKAVISGLSDLSLKTAGFSGIDPAHLAGAELDTADYNGWLTLSDTPRSGGVPAAQALAAGPVRYATGPIRIRAGHRLVITSRQRRTVEVTTPSIAVEPGGRIVLQTETTITADTLESSDGSPVNITVQGTDGAQGLQGAPGARGADGHGSMQGAPGSNGGWGTGGQDGTVPGTVTFTIGDIQTSLNISYIGGNGGTGGAGGSGGDGGSPGGNGGNGGHGGNGGNGATPGPQVTIYYKAMSPTAEICLSLQGGRAGAPGIGGAGGQGGTSGGRNGLAGNEGLPGEYGGTPSIALIKET
ncbi:hypothetical protein [uncultured Roseibium sp.]|uniref:lipase family protein n=1 Tax=uncultured Roseibium sp. TaxID=1936171 RepID=UPI00321737F4